MDFLAFSQFNKTIETFEQESYPTQQKTKIKKSLAPEIFFFKSIDRN